MEVSFDNCYSELIEGGGEKALLAYRQWTNRPGYEAVIAHVKDFNHVLLFNLGPDDVRHTIESTEHALGNVPSEHQIKEIEDFTCPFALQHIFHRYIERTGRLPTWQSFWRWMSHQARPYWLDQIAPLTETLSASYPQNRIDDAIRWRLGKFYYSALREVDLLVSMHSRDIPLKYHVLADVLLRVDYWIETTLVCIYFQNPKYRETVGGRKSPASRFFEGAPKPFQIIDFPIEKEGFGRTWLVSDNAKNGLADILRKPSS